MSLISSESEVVTKENLAEFYQAIYPYLGGYDKGKLTYVGEIRMFYSEIAPDGFLICDGSEYNKADYPELVNKLFSLTDTTPYVVDGDNTKFKVPDLRGEFLRGSGTNSHENQGNGANVGTHQDATDINDSSLMYNHYFTSSLTSKANADNVLRTSNPEWNISLTKDGSANGTVIHARPTNTSVLFCIAYKTIVVDIDFLSYGSEKFAKSNMYDTNERVVGKWIDGKPLYQKCVSGNASSTSKNWSIIASLGTDCDIVKFEAYISDDNVRWIPMGYHSGVGFDAIANFGTQVSVNGDFSVFIDDSMFANAPVFAILQYTKTTDSVDSFKYSTPTDYSTEEKIVGTWVDGKPLYQKTVYVEIPSSNYNEYSFCNDTDKVIYMNGYGYSSTYNETVTLPRVHTTANYNIETRIVSGKLRVYANVSSGVSEAYVTLQYTKTTD